jgi:predicted dehydrogenase
VDSKVEHVYANLGMTKNDQVDDYDDITIKFENGLIYHIVIGIAFFHGGNRWMVNGEKGSMCIKNWDLDDSNVIQEKEVEIEWAQEIVHTAAGPTRTMSPRPKSTINELPLPEVKTDVADFYRNVMAAIEGKEELIVRHDEVKRVFKVIEACRKSSETGEVVKLGI